MKILILPCLFFLFSQAQAQTSLHDFIQSPDGNKIEFYWSKPAGTGPFPTLLMIHPDQDSPKNGGNAFVRYGQLDYWSKKGFITIAISQPGYGKSEGSADFCGPRTQEATISLIQHFQSMPEVDSNRFFIYGGSRGAVVAGMVSATGIKLSGVILKSGVYDFVEWAASRPFYDLIKLSMFWEIGWLFEDKLKERSSYYLANKIDVPLLVIHGSKDDRAPIVLAEKFVAKVNENGGRAKFLRFESEHVIPMPKILGVIEEFMRVHF